MVTRMNVVNRAASAYEAATQVGADPETRHAAREVWARAWQCLGL